MIQRWSIGALGEYESDQPGADWVKYADHLAEIEKLRGLLREYRQLVPGWREAVCELEDFCSEPVRLKNMVAAIDQMDELRKRTDAALTN